MTSPASITQQHTPLTPRTPSIHGRFLWHEFLARDTSKAVAFYPAVMDWTVLTMAVPGTTDMYTMFASGPSAKAGVMQYPDEKKSAGAPAMWLPYMGTDDADATCRLATSLGARVFMPPTDIPTIGRIAVLADPQGAQFAVITPFPEGMPETQPVAGEFAWNEMLADDGESSFAFYSQLFGWEKKHAMDMGKDGVYQMYGRGDFVYGGFMRRSPETPAPMWNCYVRVTDLDASCDAIRKNGGKLVMGPHEVPNNDRVVIAVDNQGAVISLVSAIRK